MVARLIAVGQVWLWVLLLGDDLDRYGYGGRYS